MPLSTTTMTILRKRHPVSIRAIDARPCLADAILASRASAKRNASLTRWSQKRTADSRSSGPFMMSGVM